VAFIKILNIVLYYLRTILLLLQYYTIGM